MERGSQREGGLDISVFLSGTSLGWIPLWLWAVANIGGIAGRRRSGKCLRDRLILVLGPPTTDQCYRRVLRHPNLRW